jgi:hypothetical protein
MIATVAHANSDRHSMLGAVASLADQPIALPESSEASAGLHLLGDTPITAATSRLLPAVPDLSGFRDLRIWAESFEDAQRARISCQNRIERGGALPDQFATQLAAMKAAEHQIQLGMGGCYRSVVPAGVREWQQSMFGIGPHLLARLLGALGHPRIATPYHWEGEGENRKLIPDLMFERSVRQLWSYCGHGDATRKRRKGMTADEAFALGSPRCKMLTHLLAEATIKCRLEPMHDPSANAGTAGPTTSSDQSTVGAQANGYAAGLSSSPEQPIDPAAPKANPAARDSSAEQPTWSTPAIRGPAARRYRAVYETRRAHTGETQPDWTAGHSHNDALRIVGKHILADLWEASA